MTIETNPEVTPSQPAGDIVARAGNYYRNTRYVMAALLVGMGGWFLYDGFVKYPRENAVLADLEEQEVKAEKNNDQAKRLELQTELKKHEKHNDFALMIQRMLGFSLPPLGAVALWWALHRSRGEYRLSGTKLSIPGHPTIDLDDIIQPDINHDLWDRKGIIWLPYKTPDGVEGEIVLDDFIYDRPPTDAIYEVIAAKFGLKEDDDDDDDTDDQFVDSESESAADSERE